MLEAGGPEVRGVAIVDDASVAVSLSALRRCLNTLVAGAGRMGLQIRHNKCKLLWLHAPASDIPTQETNFFTDAGIEIVTDMAVLLKTPLGNSDQARAYIMDEVERQRPFFDNLQHRNMSPAVGGERILRLCGIPRVNFIMRTNLTLARP
jgi:hypothetical protein